MAVTDYSTTPGNNASISGTNIAEGCSPAGVNDAVRQMMADIRSFYNSTVLTSAIGVSVQAFDPDLSAVAGLSTTGLIARTGAGTAAVRTVTGGSFVTVTNGDGVSGNPTVDIPASVVVTSSETIGSNNNDTTLPTSAAVDAHIPVKMNASGSAPMYACRAWVLFAGATGTITASGNVTSVTRTGAGSYTVNFTTALPSANFVPSLITDGGQIFGAIGSRSTTTCVVNTRNTGGSLTDPNAVFVSFVG